MKRKTVFLLGAMLAITVLFSACSSQDNNGNATGTEAPNNNSMAEDIVTDTGEMVDDAVDGAGDIVNDAVDGVQDGVDNITGDNQNKKSGDIGVEKAKEVALGHAGKSMDRVTFTKTEKGSEDGVMVYDVEFREGSTEYEYEIDATNGSIRSSEAD